MGDAWGGSWGSSWGISWGTSVTPPTQDVAPYYRGGGRHDTSWWDDLLEDLASVKKAVRKKKPTVEASAKALASAIEAQQLPVELDLEELRSATEHLRLLVARVESALQVEQARQAVLAETARLIGIAEEKKRQEQADDEAIEILLLSMH